MKTCEEIRPQLGGYVLGGLEPEEAAEVREHLAHCPDCAREHAELADLPGKLDLIEAPGLALQRPAAGLEEAILDRHARERRARRAHRKASHLKGSSLSLPHRAGGARGRRSLLRGRGRLVGALAALAVAVTLAVPAGTAVRLAASGLPAGKSFELWCIRYDGRWVSAGTFRAGRDGHADVRLTAAVRRGEYGQISVTPRMSHTPAALRGAVLGY